MLFVLNSAPDLIACDLHKTDPAILVLIYFLEQKGWTRLMDKALKDLAERHFGMLQAHLLSGRFNSPNIFHVSGSLPMFSLLSTFMLLPPLHTWITPIHALELS